MSIASRRQSACLKPLIFHAGWTIFSTYTQPTRWTAIDVNAVYLLSTSDNLVIVKGVNENARLTLPDWDLYWC